MSGATSLLPRFKGCSEPRLVMECLGERMGTCGKLLPFHELLSGFDRCRRGRATRLTTGIHDIDDQALSIAQLSGLALHRVRRSLCKARKVAECRS